MSFVLQRKRLFSTSWAICGILSLALTGCETNTDKETGSAAVEVKFQNLSSTNVASVKVTVSGVGIDPDIEANLTNNAGTWSGTIDKIVAGNDRTFLAQAFDSENVLIFQGSATGVTITADNAAVVAILLQQTIPPDPYNNKAPYITSATASTNQVLTNGTITLSVVATDPDNDALTYAWTASAGTFSAEDTANTTWTAPSTPGAQTISIIVSDGKSATAGASFTITVEEIVTEGSANITVSINTWPVISSMTVNPGQVGVEENSAISVVASDFDNHTLSYAWSDDCGGAFESASTASTTWTAPSSAPESGSCTLTVNVTDEEEGSTSGSATIKIGKPAIVYSNEISELAVTTPLTGQVVLTWTDPSDSDFDHVEITYPGLTNPISIAKGVGKAVISGLATDTPIDFTIKSVDTLSNKSTGTTQSVTPVVVTLRLKTTWAEGGNPFYVATTNTQDLPDANDGIMAKLDESAVSIPNAFLWIAYPGLADPTDSTLVSFESVQTPGKYLRIDSTDPTRWPEHIGQAFAWSLNGVGDPKSHITFIEPDDETDVFKSDATFKVVPALNGDAALRSLQWHGDPSYYLQHAYYHILGRRSGAGLDNNDASLTLEQQ